MTPVRRILVATDLQDEGHHAVEYAGQLARQLHARLLVLHVDAAQAVVPGSDLAERERVADAEGMDRVVRRLVAEGTDVCGRVIPGLPEKEIVTVAERENVDLVIVGTAGKSGLMHVLLGSVADRVLRHASCPVLTVRAGEA